MTNSVADKYNLTIIYGRLTPRSVSPNNNDVKVSWSLPKDRLLTSLKLLLLDGLMLNLNLLIRLKVTHEDLVWHRASPLCIAPLIVAKLRKKPFVFEWKDNLYRGSILTGIGNMVDRINLAYATYVFVESNVLAETLSKDLRIDRAKFLITYNAVSEDDFVLNAPSRKTSNQITVGYVGSFAYYHDMPLLAESLRYLTKLERQKLEFVFVGDGPNRPHLEKELSEISGVNCRWMGKRPINEIPSLLNQMDICLLPGTTDIICPIKIMEYMAAGKPVVLPKYECNLEVLPEEMGFYFTPKNAISLKGALMRAASQRFSCEKRKALVQFTREHFTWKSTYLAALDFVQKSQA